MPLPFNPCCQPLLLGSLPHRHVKQAFELSRRYAGTLLAWPQLPQRHYREQLLVQSVHGFPGLVINDQGAQVYIDRKQVDITLNQLALAYLENTIQYGALTDNEAAGLFELQQQPEAVAQARALKGQLLGPISLATQLTDEQQRPIIHNEVLFDALVQHLQLRLAWQQARLGALHGTTIICLDEPFLELVGLPFLPLDWPTARERIEQVFQRVVGCRGLMAGGAVDWSEALQTSVELIIADVYHHATTFAVAGPALAAFLERGGVIGLGLVPADQDELAQTSVEQLLQHVDDLLVTLNLSGIEPKKLLQRAVISPADSLGEREPATAEQVLALVKETSERVRQQYNVCEP
jgi:hypothetical protein